MLFIQLLDLGVLDAGGQPRVKHEHLVLGGGGGHRGIDAGGAVRVLDHLAADDMEDEGAVGFDNDIGDGPRIDVGGGLEQVLRFGGTVGFVGAGDGGDV